MPTGADLVVKQLALQGVKWISTLCGNGMDPLYDACRKAGVRVVDTHNEQAAAYMADAYARLTGRLAVCAVSSGIAHCNALTGVANAYFDGAPLLLITGASSGYGAGRGVFQEFDQVGLAGPICKYSAAVLCPGDLVYMLREAISAALSPRRGPVHLTIPRAILESTLEATRPLSPVARPQSGPPDQGSLEILKSKLGASRKPLLVAGTGLFFSEHRGALAAFSEAYGAPIVAPIWDRGCVEERHPGFVGVVGAASGQPDLLAEADLLLLAGARGDYRVGFLSPPAVAEDAFIARIDEDPAELRQGERADLAITADPGLALQELVEVGGDAKLDPAWMSSCQEKWREFRSPWLLESGGHDKLTGRDIVDCIRPVLDEDITFLIDGGNIGQWAHMVLGDRYPSSWLTCGASAVVGWGLPGAMGARLAHPDRPVLLLSGDGAFGFTTAEIESAARQDLPFVAVVANDSAWGIVVCGQREAWGSTVACETCEIRFDKVAEALGARGLRVTERSDLTPAIRDALAQGVPTVIDVPIIVESPSDAKKPS